MAEGAKEKESLQRALKLATTSPVGNRQRWENVAKLALDARRRFPNAGWWFMPLARSARRTEIATQDFLNSCDERLEEDEHDVRTARLLLSHHLGRGSEGDVVEVAIRLGNSDHRTTEQPEDQSDFLVLAAKVLH